MTTLLLGATWRYQVNLGYDPALYSAPGYDDGAWPSGPTPMGYGSPWDTYTPRTGPLAGLSNVWLRTTLPRMAAGEVTFTGPAVDDNMLIFIDGVEVAAVNFTASPWLRGPFAVGEGEHVCAIYGWDTVTSAMFVGAAISYTGESPKTRLYPRDDSLGLSAGPRIHPPPRSRRIAGGHK